MKCLLAKAMTSKEDKSLTSSILFEMQQMKLDMHAMSKVQMKLNDKMGKLEQQLQLIHNNTQVLGPIAHSQVFVDLNG